MNARDFLAWFYAPNLPSIFAAPLRILLVALLVALVMALWKDRKRFGGIELSFLLLGAPMVLAAATLNLFYAATFPTMTTRANVVSLVGLVLFVFGVWHRVGSVSYLARIQKGLVDHHVADG